MLEILIVFRLEVTVVYFCLSILLLTAACSSEDELSEFSSDGCSLFPDASLINESDWCKCCVQHDVSYWKGGTKQERKIADQLLRQCVFTATSDQVLADIMYEGVRFGGSPYFYNWYRWGYGWGYERKYQPLSHSEIQQVNAQLAKYNSSASKPVCKK